MFDSVPMAPQDAILGLNEAFRSDPNPAKINLSVGVYQDASGKTPILRSVKLAEERILSEECTKTYLGITGSPDYARCVQELLLGKDHEVCASGRIATAHTPGGTAALRVAGDFIKRLFPQAQVWFGRPTWPNHTNVFAATGVATQEYPYFDPATGGIAEKELLAAFEQIPEGDIVLLHGCCHNPTGIDPSPALWQQMADLIAERKLLPLVDLAYQGFADGLREDTAALANLCQRGRELILCSSFSKNFGLYSERVGAISLVAGSSETLDKVQSQIKKTIRSNYSNPPAHGAAIVTTILRDAKLRTLWEEELKGMRDRISQMRQLLVRTLAEKGVRQDFSFITQQRGMFSFSGLNPEQVETLRDKHSIYIVGSGRINVAGMTEANMDTLCTAIASVV